MNSDMNIPSDHSTARATMCVNSFESRLLTAIEKRFNLEAKKVIAEHALWNVTDKKNNTLLHYAAKHNNSEMVDYLLGSGCRVDARNTLGQTPLMIAAWKLYWGRTIEILMKANPNIYHGQESGRSALQLVADRKFVSKAIIKLFHTRLENDCSYGKEEIAYRIFRSRWPLPKVVQLEDQELTRIMLQRGYFDRTGIDAVENNDLGRTALHIAVMNLDVESVKILLEYKANMVEDSEGRTPLSYVYDSDSDCQTKEKLDILKLLLQRIGEAPIDPKQSLEIFRRGSEEAIKLIVQSNVDLKAIARDFDKRTSVHFLAQNQNPGTIQHLLNKQFDVNKRSNEGETPLMNAALSQNLEAIEFLMNAGADIDARNTNRHTAQMDMLNRGVRQQPYRETVRALLEAGTNAQISIGEVKTETVFHIIWDQRNLILGDLVLAHLAFQEAQGIKISQLITEAIDSRARFRDFFLLSRQQLKTKIYGTTTLFDLLTATDHKLDIYGRDRAFVPMVQDVVATLSDNNYYYSKLLRKRIAKVILRLRKRSARLVCKIMGTNYDSFPFIADDIAGHLELSYMRSLINAVLESPRNSVN